MTWSDSSSPGVTGQETYFFLSYAHSVPLSDAARPDTDYWVGQFFQDLAEAVRDHPRRAAEIEVGFFDGQVNPGADLRRTLTDALSLAHVFVPLYSPNYFRNAWALGERDSFRGRLTRLSAGRAQRHVLPVLWMPLPSWEDRPETVQALELVRDPDDRADYADNGLRALCKLSAYRVQYRSLLGALADRIVTVAEHEPLARSRATPLTSNPVPDGPGTALVVTTLTADRVRWRPYGDQHQLAVADYVAATAERLGLPTRVVELAEARDRAPSSPAVVLVDVRVGVDAARVALDGLPPWVVPLVIAADHARGEPTPRRSPVACRTPGFPGYCRCAPSTSSSAARRCW